MTKTALQDTTGNAQADAVVERVVALFEARFPGRISGYYVEGSYADGTAVATSDLDLSIVFRGQFATPSEQELAQQVAANIHPGPLELDITLFEETSLAQHADPCLDLEHAYSMGKRFVTLFPSFQLSNGHARECTLPTG